MSRTRTEAAPHPTPAIGKVTPLYNAKPKPEPIDNTEIVKQFRAQGGHILHMRPDKDSSRGMTAVFIQKGRRMEIAVSLTHGVDHFSKKQGTKTALAHFAAGKTVTLPMNVSPGKHRSENAIKRLKNALLWLCVDD